MLNPAAKSCIWDDLIAKHGEVVACFGADTDNYWQSGEAAWNRVIAPRLGPLPGVVVMEWGAGTGRVARAAAGHVARLWAYEPSGAARALLQQNLAATSAAVVGPEGLPLVPALDALYCIFTMHHMDYDALWEFFGFAEQRLQPGGVLLFDYIEIMGEIGRAFLARKDSSEWPIYVWHRAQIKSLLLLRAPSLRFVELAERPRELQVWRKSDNAAA